MPKFLSDNSSPTAKAAIPFEASTLGGGHSPFADAMDTGRVRGDQSLQE